MSIFRRKSSKKESSPRPGSGVPWTCREGHRNPGHKASCRQCENARLLVSEADGPDVHLRDQSPRRASQTSFSPSRETPTPAAATTPSSPRQDEFQPGDTVAVKERFRHPRHKFKFRIAAKGIFLSEGVYVIWFGGEKCETKVSQEEARRYLVKTTAF